VIAGGVVSCIVIWKDPVVVLFWPSAAEHVTVVIPSGNVAPEVGVHVTGIEFPEASDAVTVKVTAAPEGPVASTVMFAGKVRVGGVVIWMGLTVIVKEPELVLPRVSLAEQFTVVMPTGKVEPEEGEQDTETEPSTKSIAETV
jgi:hypothetical protein